jgi:hypothetical protein
MSGFDPLKEIQSIRINLRIIRRIMRLDLQTMDQRLAQLAHELEQKQKIGKEVKQ